MNVDVFSWFDNVQTAMAAEGSLLKPWAEILPQQLHSIFNEKVHGDQQRWLDALESLPAIENIAIDLEQDRIQLSSDSITEDVVGQVKAGAAAIRPLAQRPLSVF